MSEELKLTECDVSVLSGLVHKLLQETIEARNIIAANGIRTVEANDYIGYLSTLNRKVMALK